MNQIQSFLLGALLVGVAVLAYLYIDGRQRTVEIKLPDVKIEKH